WRASASATATATSPSARSSPTWARRRPRKRSNRWHHPAGPRLGRVSLFRDRNAGRSDPDEPVVGYQELRRSSRAGVLDVGTLACPCCDAPVALGSGALAPSDCLSCPY